MNIKRNFQLFKQSKPGQRFTDLQKRRKEAEKGKLPIGRIINITLGVALILVGIFLLALPGPGITLSVLGCGLLGGESRMIARFLDRGELKLREWWPPVKAFWKRLPAPVQWLLILLGLSVAGYLTWISIRPWLE